MRAYHLEELSFRDLKTRSLTIAEILAQSSIPNDNMTRVALIHLILCVYIGEKMNEVEIALNFASLIQAAQALAGEGESMEDREHHVVTTRKPS